MIAQGINHEKLRYLLDTVRTGLRCYFSSSMLKKHNGRDQARGRLGRNILPRGRNFALNGTQGEVGVSLKKKKFFFFLGRLIFILSPHKCKLW